MAAATEVAAGTAVEAAADRARAHVVDAMGGVRLGPGPATGATNESGDEGLGEEAAAEAAKEKKRGKQREGSSGGAKGGGGSSSKGGSGGIGVGGGWGSKGRGRGSS